MTTDPPTSTSLRSFLSADVEAELELDDDADDVGSRIATARVAAGIDREILGARVGVDADVVTEWESGQDSPRSNQLVAIAGLLGVSPSWLMIGHGDAPDDPHEARPVAAEMAEIRAELEHLARRLERLADALPTADDAD